MAKINKYWGYVAIGALTAAAAGAVAALIAKKGSCKEDFDFEKESALDIDDHDSDEDDGDFADLDSFEDEEELDSSDDYLDLEFDEKPAPEPEKETSKSAQTPDIDEVLEIEEPSEDEINSIPDSLYRVVTI